MIGRPDDKLIFFKAIRLAAASGMRFVSMIRKGKCHLAGEPSRHCLTNQF